MAPQLRWPRALVDPKGSHPTDADTVTAAEFTFLALGLVLGVAAGAALLEVLRARPRARPEVRVTVATDAIPHRRAATLSDDAFVPADVEPARGGPADHGAPDPPAAGTPGDHRTAVRSGVAAAAASNGTGPAGPTPGRTTEPAFRLSDTRGQAVEPEMVGIAVDGGADPLMAALHASALSAAMRARESNGSEHDPFLEPMLVPAVIASVPPARGPQDDAGLFVSGTVKSSMSGGTSDGGGGSTDAGPAGGGGSTGGGAPGDPAGSSAAAAAGAAGVTGSAGDPVDACAAERRVAAERCGLAVGARVRATEAADLLRSAQRTYDDHITAAEAAAAISDARAVRREKEAAQSRFRAAYNGSKSTEEAEAAARDWLVDINEVNTAARTAAVTAKREKAAAASIGGRLERLTLEADAARIAAEASEAACLVARQALAECDERAVAGAAQSQPPAPWTERPTGPIDEDEPLAAALSAGVTPTIFRLLRGDRTSLTALVTRLAGEDPILRRTWQTNLTQLIEAIIAVSIEAGALEYPADHPFWGTFTLTQDRDISQALASLGHRFDGLGGFIDDRVPTQRDLSMAMGYAGLDPMRIRQWPTETEMAALYSDVTVAADEHLAGTAGDLSLSELIALLGRRADGLADLWNDWGRVRPLLLEGA